MIASQHGRDYSDEVMVVMLFVVFVEGALKGEVTYSFSATLAKGSGWQI